MSHFGTQELYVVCLLCRSFNSLDGCSQIDVANTRVKIAIFRQYKMVVCLGNDRRS